MIDYEQQPDGTPDTTRLAEWKAICNQCGTTELLIKADRWLFAVGQGRDEHFCPRCESRTARRLIEDALGRRRLAVRLAARVRSWRGRRASRLRTDAP